MKIYYAHPITTYNTDSEGADLHDLARLGFSDVLNPNAPEHDAGYKQHGMEYFMGLVDECDALAYRAFPDGSIPAGVYKEMARAVSAGKPVFELQPSTYQRVLTVADTRKKLIELGRINDNIGI